MIDSPATEEAYRYCDDLARQRARNFYPAFRFLPVKRRLSLSAYYAYCSLSDDIADDDNPMTVEQKEAALAAWRSKLTESLNGSAAEPVFIALSDTVRQFQLPEQLLFDLLDGIEMDLRQRRYNTFADLDLYCRRVASSVGRVSVRIFGINDTSADDYADNLGMAFQLTNIMRDVVEDLDRDRIYLPQEDLQRFSYSESELSRKVYDDRFRALMRFQYDRAIGFFDRALLEEVGSSTAALLPAEIMRSVYRRLLEQIRRDHFDVLSGRISVPKWRMVGGMARTFLRMKLIYR